MTTVKIRNPRNVALWNIGIGDWFLFEGLLYRKIDLRGSHYCMKADSGAVICLSRDAMVEAVDVIVETV